MFSLAYVILPFSDVPPADAIRASLARFKRGRPGDVPADWIEFIDETPVFQKLHEARLVFTLPDGGGMQFEGTSNSFDLDIEAVRTEMRRLQLTRWAVRFADLMSLDEFFDRFCMGSERHPGTGAFGRWLNPLGRWDWWDLGGRFDGAIVGERRAGSSRTVSQVSSGESRGRAILGNIENALSDALGQERPDTVDISTDQNIELVATLLEYAKAGQGHATPGAIVLPPGVLHDRLRWVETWPDIRPLDTVAWLGLPFDAPWKAIVAAAYQRFQDCWAAGVAYHH